MIVRQSEARYSAFATLFGRIAGELHEPVKMTIRLVRPDGVRVSRQAVYDGNELSVSLDESTERETKPDETIQ